MNTRRGGEQAGLHLKGGRCGRADMSTSRCRINRRQSSRSVRGRSTWVLTVPVQCTSVQFVALALYIFLPSPLHLPSPPLPVLLSISPPLPFLSPPLYLLSPPLPVAPSLSPLPSFCLVLSVLLPGQLCRLAAQLLFPEDGDVLRTPDDLVLVARCPPPPLALFSHPPGPTGFGRDMRTAPHGPRGSRGVAEG